MDTTYTQEEANQFIIECHTDVDTVRSKLVETPDLARAYNPDLVESALGAAGHMGRPDIAELLLAHGAELELAAAAMLGDREFVAAQLAQDPELAKSGGAHNIPVAFHAAMSGDVELMQMLWEAGAEEQVRGALFGAVWKNQVEMARWLLDRGASTDGKNFQGQTMFEAAQEAGYDQIVELLQAHG